MENYFVDYLNAMNNAGSNTIAALAESQVLSEYYEKIHIERVLGKRIAEQIRSGEHIAYIITGHAGDGKTSILVQILTELGLLEKKQPLQEEKCYDFQNTTLYTVKDMSELPEKKQIVYFQKAVTAPKNNGSSVLISNTGPLLKCFEKLVSSDMENDGKAFTEQDKNTLQNTILVQLDENKPELIEVGNYRVMIINIARIDNVDFARNAISKLLLEELWSPCHQCPKSEFCPIFHNVQIVRHYEKRVEEFITAYYRFLYENDKRMTIRQMLSQLSFAFTGNLTCKNIRRNMRMPQFKHLFSNQFFGNFGIEPEETAMQIQGITYVNEMKLDAKALRNDYQMFVTGDFSALPSEIRELAEEQYTIFSRWHFNSDEYNQSNQKNSKDVLYRKAIRRMYIMFGDYHEYSLFDELFGNGFQNYQKLITSQNTKHEQKMLKNTIMEALYMESTGVAAKHINEIPLTLRRNDNLYQKVLVISGRIKAEDLKIEISDGSSCFDDNQNKKVLNLVICNNKKFRLTLPMMIYFEQLADGEITTSANPALTHGISKLKTLLRECGHFTDADDEIQIMLNKTDRAEYKKLEFDGTMLYI